MIQVRHITKRFGGFPAVRDLSFDALDATVTGLLGLTTLAAALLLIACARHFFERDAIAYGD